MARSLQRQNAVSTLRTAVGWLAQAPALVGVFLVLGLFTAAGQLNPLVSLLGNLLGIVAGGVVHRSAADLAWDRPLGLGENARIAGRRLLSLVGIGIVVFVATFLATLLLVIPGIYVSLRLSLAPVACVVDDLGVGDSLSTSWDVAQGNLLKLFGIQLATGGVSVLAAVIVLSLTGGLDALARGDSMALFRSFLLLAPVTAVVAPIGQFAVARVYLENRDDRDSTDEPEENLTAQPGEAGWDDLESDDPAADPWDDGETESGREDRTGDAGNRWEER